MNTLLEPTLLNRKSARLEKRPLAPSKPPMRLVGKRVHKKAYASFRSSK